MAHEILCQRLAVAARVAGIEQHFQNFEFSEGGRSLVKQLGPHTGPMSSLVIGLMMLGLMLGLRTGLVFGRVCERVIPMARIAV